MKENKSNIIVVKVTTDEINSIVETLLPKLYQGISTQKKISEAFRLLGKFIGELFKHQEYFRREKYCIQTQHIAFIV